MASGGGQEAFKTSSIHRGGKRKRHSFEQIITKLREADTMLAAGATIAKSCNTSA